MRAACAHEAEREQRAEDRRATIVTAATSKLATSEVLMSGSFQNARYQRKLRPPKTWSDFDELNE